MFILQEESLLVLFCSVDDFCQDYLPVLAAQSLPEKSRRNRARSLSHSEIMTLLITFQQSHFRDFKAFYLGFVCRYWKSHFPKLVSYNHVHKCVNRFIEYVPSVLVLLATYLKTLLGKCRGVTFIDSVTRRLVMVLPAIW